MIDSKFKFFYLFKIAFNLLKAKFFNKSIPLFIGWGITDKCNYHCRYCYIPDIKREKELSTSEVFTIIDGLAKLGTVRINLTGGEPLLRKDIGGIVKYIRNKGIHVGMNSNGSLVPQKINVLKNIDILMLSFDGPKKIQDRQRQPGSYEDIVNALKLAGKYNIKVILYTVLTKDNIKYVNYILDFAKQFKTYVMFSPVNQFPFQEKQRNNSFYVPIDVYKKTIKKLIHYKKQGNSCIVNSLTGLRHLYDWPHHRKINCAAAKIYYRIQPDGDVYGCGNFVSKSSKVNCLRLGVEKALRGININPCENCWCANRVEMNFVWSLYPEAVFNAIKLL